MDRRDFIKSAGIAAAGGALAGAGLASRPSQAQVSGPMPGPQPNILFILVDELRFPSVFPSSVTATDPFQAVDQFLAQYMPNVHALWQSGVKFGSHYTAATACSPARGVLISGLYSQQSWLLQTIKGKGLGVRASPTPPLNPVFPTYGKLLRAAGYTTPYIGKWHVSIPQKILLPVSRTLRLIPGCMRCTASTAALTRTRTAPTCKGPSATTPATPRTSTTRISPTKPCRT